MVKFEWKPFSVAIKQNHVVVTISLVFLLVVSFLSLYSYSFQVAPFVEAPESNGAEIQEKNPRHQIPQKGNCDLFIGDWVPDPLGPVYSNESCHVIIPGQNCMKNGRPDSGYLYWRWKPRDCEIPRFNGARFLEMMRDKSWGFIGDSIARNHVQSLFCILSKVEAADEISHDEEGRPIRWYFPSYNFTLAVIWSPLLLKAAISEDTHGVASSDMQLHLDKLDEQWIHEYQNFNYVTISGGKWFLKTAIYHYNDTVVGCHYCSSHSNLTEFGYDKAYRQAVKLVFNFIIKSNHSAVVFFRTTTPSHFENGEWFSGGTCNRTMPYKEGEVRVDNVDSVMHDIELEEFHRAVTNSGFKTRVKLKLLDTMQLSSLRPDGHPGPYIHFYPFAKDNNAIVQNDCLHWCLPGPIDSWNDLVMEMLMHE